MLADQLQGIREVTWVGHTGVDVEAMFCKLVGISFEGRDEVVRSYVVTGLSVFLKREPDNAYDRNAISVVLGDGTSVGYIPAVVARMMAPDMDVGIVYDASVYELDAERDYVLPEVTLLIERRGYRDA